MSFLSSVSEFLDNDSLRLAGALAFNAIFSIPPLLLIIIKAAGFFFVFRSRYLHLFRSYANIIFVYHFYQIGLFKPGSINQRFYLDNFNDTLQDAEELLRFSKIIPCKINLIEYNPIANADFVNTDDDRLQNFIYYLADRGCQVNVRRSRGKDIDAACGQLAVKEKQTV